MSTTRQRFLDLLAIGRVANLPTVWSNLAVGYLFAYAVTSGIDPNLVAELFDFSLLLLATTCARVTSTTWPGSTRRPTGWGRRNR